MCLHYGQTLSRQWGSGHGGKNFSDSVNFLLACELDRLGYKREMYEPGIYEPKPSEKAGKISG
jgi:hypothetical protein